MKRIKWLCLTLLLFLFVGAVFACGPKGPEGKQKKLPPRAEGTVWEDVDFSGTVLRISISVEQNMGASTPTSDRYIRGLDSASSDDVVNLVMNRNQDVSDTLGIAVLYQEAYNQYDDVQGYIEELVMASNASTPDIFIDDAYGGIRAAMSGSLYNLLDTDEQNYFELTEEKGWYVDFMDGLTLNPDVKYLLAGDYFIDVLRSAHVLFVNIERYEEIIGDIEANLYADVAAGNWTYDALSTLATVGWDEGPNNKTGSAQVDDDVIGFVCDTICVYPFFYGSAHSLYEKDAQGNYTVPYEHQTYFSFAKDIFDLLTAQAVYRTNDLVSTTRSSQVFANGNVLLTEGMYIADFETPEIRNMEDRKGVVVYPKQNMGTAGYNTYVHDLAECGMIALSTENFSACTAYLQCSNEWSDEVFSRYAEFAVKFKYNKDPATGEMLDIIYDSIGSPFEGLMVGLAFDLAGGPTTKDAVTPQRALTLSVNNKNNVFVNSYQTSHNLYVAGIGILADKFKGN